jgi:hypothetical protein
MPDKHIGKKTISTRTVKVPSQTLKFKQIKGKKCTTKISKQILNKVETKTEK